jgi:hypothetical protein
MYCGGFILFCSVCISGFCNVCVCEGFVMCGCFWQYVYCTVTEVFLNLTEVFLNLTEVFPCFSLSCKANARVKLAKMGHDPHCTTLAVFVLFGCYLCCFLYCLCVNVYCHWVTTILQLINISYHISYSCQILIKL